MAGYRKLGRVSDQRIAILRNLATSLVVCPVKEDGKALSENRKHVVTTVARAKEVSKIMDKLIADAIREKDNFTTKEVTVSSAKLDAKGMKVLVSKTSKNGKKYEVVDRQVSKKTVQVALNLNVARVNFWSLWRQNLSEWSLDRSSSL